MVCSLFHLYEGVALKKQKTKNQPKKVSVQLQILDLFKPKHIKVNIFFAHPCTNNTVQVEKIKIKTKNLEKFRILGAIKWKMDKSKKLAIEQRAKIKRMSD